MKPHLIIIIFFGILFFSCEKSPSKYIYNEGFVYGTMYHFVYESPEGKDLQEEITKKLNEYNSMFSTYDKESVISKINSNEKVKLTPEFVACYNRAMEISKITNGAFDITAGPMVNAWGFGPEEKKKMTQEKVDSLKEITGFEKLTFVDGKIVKANPNMKLDMSAIAKGYTCDLIGNFLNEKGCKNYMIDIGGEIVAKGQNEKGKVWSIGISNPDENAFFAETDYDAVVQLPGNALATSGNYRNFYEEGGKKYAHTIDPKSGYPVQHSILSSTVLSENCMTADAYATAFMVLGLEEGIEVIKKVPEIAVYFIYSGEDGKNHIYMSENFENYLRK